MGDYFDPNDRQAREDERRRTAREFDRQACEALAAIASTRDGMVFLRWCIGQSGLLVSAYPLDHAQAAYREGKRSLGAQLIAMAAQAGKLPEILKEQDNG